MNFSWRLAEALGTLTNTPYYHGISPIDVDLMAQCRKIAKDGFDSARPAYLTPDIGMALSYRRDLDFDENATDNDLRGIAEFNILSDVGAVLDGDMILEPNLELISKTPERYLDEHWPGLSNKTKQLWLLLNKIYAEWADFGSEPEGNLEYREHFGDVNIYDASQEVAKLVTREISKIPQWWSSSRNIVIQGPIKPTDVYVFKQIPGTKKYVCIKRLLNKGVVQLNDVHEMGTRM